jgi:hypothetical protein
MTDPLLSKFVISAIDGQRYCRTNGQFTRHLVANDLTYRQYYETYVTGKEEICPYCGKPKTFYQKNNTYGETCGEPVCVGKVVSQRINSWDETKKAKVSERKSQGLKKLLNSEEGREIIERRVATNRQLDENGLDGWQRGNLKSRETKEARYGDPNYNNHDQTMKQFAKHTVARKEEIIDKRRKTNLDRYGIENMYLHPSCIRQSAKGNASIYDYTLPSGRVIGIRGFEGRVVSLLLEQYVEDEIKVHDSYVLKDVEVPIIPYIAVPNRNSKYYPDIYIPKENRIIEVKSRWWYDAGGRPGYESRIENNRRKKKACEDAGFVFEFWVFDAADKYEVIK